MSNTHFNKIKQEAYIDFSKAIIIKTRFKEIQQDFKRASMCELVPCSVSNAINSLCEALDDLIKIKN